MKSITQRFKQIKKDYPQLSDYIIFSKAIDSRGYKKWEVRKRFKLLVSKKNYANDEIEEVLAYLLELNLKDKTKLLKKSQW